MSCNGCRVLRKGCSDSCVLRQCLRWIESPDAQGHATVFVAKFFGRAGMMALISSVPEPQRPALFQSLLFEACGRTVNPVFGAVGLLCSGNWKLCHEAVETVMNGGLLSNMSSGTGRPGAAWHPPGVSPGANTGAGFKLPRVRAGRGGGNSPQMLMTKSSVVKEEMLEEEVSDEAHKARRSIGVKRKAMAMRPRFAGDEGEEEDDKKLKVGGSGKFSASCGDEGPGLDLTLGSSNLMPSSAIPAWGRGQRITVPPPVEMEMKPGAATNFSSNRRSSSPVSCHSSSEADSDTTDLSISMIQQHCQAPFPDRSSRMSREFLLDLLH